VFEPKTMLLLPVYTGITGRLCSLVYFTIGKTPPYPKFRFLIIGRDPQVFRNLNSGPRSKSIAKPP
ncbi:MAG: hypothetical protein J7K65_03480, partial [Planctomycetes bacterium]|nr:hypothetical protein [Planctomycetota bacterium]